MLAAGTREPHPTSGRSCIAHQNWAVGCGCGRKGLFWVSLSIRRFWGKRGKMEAKKGESWSRETPDTDAFTWAFHPHTAWFDTIQSKHFRSLGCELHVSKSSPKINVTLRSGRAPVIVLLPFSSPPSPLPHLKSPLPYPLRKAWYSG